MRRNPGRLEIKKKKKIMSAFPTDHEVADHGR